MRRVKEKLAVGKTPIARSRLTVKNFDFGLGRDAERRGRRSKPHRLVKPRLEFPDWPVHNDDCRAIINSDDTAQTIFKAKDIASPQPKRMFNRPPDDADKLRLIRINAVSPAALPACAHLFGAALESRFLLVCMCFHGLFFVLCCSVSVSRPSLNQPAQAGRLAGVVFRGHHESPLLKSGK
jgi:hypothetical protein